MPIRQLGDAGAQSTVTAAITAVQTSVTLVSGTGFPAILSGGQESVIILDSGNPAYSATSPLATPYEYQPVNTVVGNVLTFGLGGGGASRAAYSNTTNHAYFAGATVALASLAEDYIASVPWKFDEQSPSGVGSVRIPASGTIPASYLGVNYRHLQIIGIARGDTAALFADIWLQFHGDTATNYDYNQLVGNNAAASSFGVQSTANPAIARMPAASAPAGVAGDFTIDVVHFANTAFAKHAKGLCASFEGTGLANWYNIFRSVHWFTSGTAVDFLTLGCSAGNFAAGTLICTYLIP